MQDPFYNFIKNILILATMLISSALIIGAYEKLQDRKIDATKIQRY